MKKANKAHSYFYLPVVDATVTSRVTSVWYTIVAYETEQEKTSHQIL